MKKLIIFIVVNLLLCGLTLAQRLPEFEKAREIKLLEMNRDDVRKIFADYKLNEDENSNHRDLFSADNAEIKVFYSEGKCRGEESEGYNVSEWIVTQINISPKTSIRLKNIGMYLSKYKKERIFKNEADRYLYHNKDLGIGLEARKDDIDEIDFIPPKKYYSLFCDKHVAKILSTTKSWFYEPLKKRLVIVDVNDPADVVNLILSLPGVTADCSASDSAEDKSCSDGVKIIAVFAVGKDLEGDVLTYDYKVSDGKIIGHGEKVVWDLSGVKAGTYTITAAVDDGCGFCGKSMTKTVVVKECPDCSNK